VVDSRSKLVKHSVISVLTAHLLELLEQGPASIARLASLTQDLELQSVLTVLSASTNLHPAKIAALVAVLVSPILQLAKQFASSVMSASWVTPRV